MRNHPSFDAMQYAVLTPQGAKQVQEKLQRLTATCDALAQSNHEQKNRINELEAYVRYLERLKESYEDPLVAKAGFSTPQPPQDPEPFSA